MGWMNKLSRTALSVGFAAALSGSPAQAAVLTFDGSICGGGATCTNFAEIDQSYGDTATVDVQYNFNVNNPIYTTGATGSGVEFWDTGYNDLTNVAFGQIGGTPMIFLRPLAAGFVTLASFDLGAWPNAVNPTQVTIVDGLGNALFSSGPILVGTGNVHSSFTPNLSSANGIGIQWGPDGYNVGIDNVTFSFTPRGTGGVPEPATWAMMMAGIGAIGGAMRRRRVGTRLALA